MLILYFFFICSYDMVGIKKPLPNPPPWGGNLEIWGYGLKEYL